MRWRIHNVYRIRSEWKTAANGPEPAMSRSIADPLAAEQDVVIACIQYPLPYSSVHSSFYTMHTYILTLVFQHPTLLLYSIQRLSKLVDTRHRLVKLVSSQDDNRQKSLFSTSVWLQVCRIAPTWSALRTVESL